MLKEEREARKWAERLRGLMEDRILHLEALVITMVVDDDDLKQEQAKLEALDALDYNKLGFIKYVESLQEITGVLIKNQPSIYSVYQEQRQVYVEGYLWFTDVVNEIVKKLIVKFKSGAYSQYYLDSDINVVGMVINTKSILNLLDESAITEGIDLSNSDRERVIAIVVQDLSRLVAYEGAYMGMIGVRTGANTFNGTRYKEPMERLVAKYNIEFGEHLTFFISKQALSLPDVYLPSNLDTRKEFLTLYREVGFNNKFFESKQNKKR